jgi:hypothetical protein
MNKTILRVPLAIFILSVLIVSCNRGSKSAVIPASSEILPEDIVELRGDQVKLAKIELGSV